MKKQRGLLYKADDKPAGEKIENAVVLINRRGRGLGSPPDQIRSIGPTPRMKGS